MKGETDCCNHTGDTDDEDPFIPTEETFTPDFFVYKRLVYPDDDQKLDQEKEDFFEILPDEMV